MHYPLITVGIPFYNNESSLLRAIKSVFSQDYPNWELVMVDDGSSDKSCEIAKSIDDSRVRVLDRDGKNRKLPYRLNQIAKNANGIYLARMDADDICCPDRLKIQYEFLKNNPNIDVVGGAVCILNLNDQAYMKQITSRRHEEIFGRKYFSGVDISHPTVMAKTQWFLRWPYDEKNIRNEDYELWIRSSENSKFANVPQIVCFKSEFGSYSLSKYVKSMQTMSKVIWKYGVSDQGMLKTLVCILFRYLRILIYFLCVIFRLENSLIKKRYIMLKKVELEELNGKLKMIENVDVYVKKGTQDD